MTHSYTGIRIIKKHNINYEDNQLSDSDSSIIRTVMENNNQQSYNKIPPSNNTQMNYPNQMNMMDQPTMGYPNQMNMMDQSSMNMMDQPSMGYPNQMNMMDQPSMNMMDQSSMGYPNQMNMMDQSSMNMMNQGTMGYSNQGLYMGQPLTDMNNAQLTGNNMSKNKQNMIGFLKGNDTTMAMNNTMSMNSNQPSVLSRLAKLSK